MNKLIKIVTAVGLLTVASLLTGCTVIDTGHRGVLTNFGEVRGEALSEGLHFHMPVSQAITEFDVRVQRFDNKTSIYSQDAQIVEAGYTLNFHPVRNKIHVLYKNVGPDYANILIPQILEGTLKEVFGRYKAVNLITMRQEAVFAVKELITSRLLAKNIVLTNFELTNLDFDDQFEEAVKQKVIAVELTKKSRNLMEKAKNDKQIIITAAEAEAQSMRIRANALKTNKGLVEYEAIQKWNGVLPTFMMSGSKGAVPFVNITPGK